MIKLLLLLFLPFLGGHSKSTKSAVNTDLGISGWYTGYLKLYDSSKQYYERYNVQIKIYQKENIIIASALDLVMAGHCYAISELNGFIYNGKLYLRAKKFRQKKTDNLTDFILSDYTFPLNESKFWYGTVLSFYDANRQIIIGDKRDVIFLERKTNTMNLQTLYQYKLPILVDKDNRKHKLTKDYKRGIEFIDDIFSLKQRKGKHH